MKIFSAETLSIFSGMLWILIYITNKQNRQKKSMISQNQNKYIQGVPYYWTHFLFAIFSASGARTEVFLTIFQQPWKFATW